MTGPAVDPVAFLRAAAPWLFERSLGACLVGTHALARACAAAGIAGPEPADLDLAWGLDVEAGRALLQRHGVLVPTTGGNLERGTVAAKLGGERVEITTFRAGDPKAGLAVRVEADLRARDMTVGALALELATGLLHDPLDGLAHWRQRRIVPCGDAAQRVREHPVRWLRYYRKAHEWDCALDRTVRSLDLAPRVLDGAPKEAISLELRAILQKLRSPGRCLIDLFECGIVPHLWPELGRQFDGRPAGPQRWHPEVSQALHLVLALEWAVERTAHLDDRDRAAVLLAVLCHDFGKGHTHVDDLPGHPGHEQEGVPYVKDFLDAWPGLADARSKTLALHVCELHVEIRRFGELRAGTQARLYDRFFRPADYPVDLFALAVGADTGGRLGLAASGDHSREQVARDLAWLRMVCGAVDGAPLRARHGDDLDAFRTALHEARARALAEARPRRPGATAIEAADDVDAADEGPAERPTGTA